jgi:hypothetical protein
VENLVRVRIPDAADDAGIGQCPLESPVFTDQRGAEARQIGRENVYASRVHGEQAGLAATTWSDALRLLPASVSVSEPGGKPDSGGR